MIDESIEAQLDRAYRNGYIQAWNEWATYAYAWLHESRLDNLVFLESRLSFVKEQRGKQ